MRVRVVAVASLRVDGQALVDGFAQRILDAMSVAFSVAGEDIFASVSIGIAVYPEDGAEIDALVERADQAHFDALLHGCIAEAADLDSAGRLRDVLDGLVYREALGGVAGALRLGRCGAYASPY